MKTNLLTFALVGVLATCALAQDVETGADALAIQAPEISELILNLKKELEAYEPTGKETLYDARDVDAFDLAQAQLYVIYHQVAKSMSGAKRALGRGVLAVAKQAKLDKAAAGQTAERYRQAIKKRITEVLQVLTETTGTNTAIPGLERCYYSKAETKVSAVVCYGTDNAKTVVYGNPEDTSCMDSNQVTPACGFKRFDVGHMLYSAAEACVSEFCVLEVQNLAMELLGVAKSLDVKVNLHDDVVRGARLFFSPNDPRLRKALSDYIDDNVTNKEVSAIELGLLGLTNIAFTAVLTPVDMLAKLAALKAVKISLDVNPKFFQGANSYTNNRNEIARVYGYLHSQRIQ